MKRNTTERERDIFLYLNDLRESGDTNMFGAAPYIEKDFDIEIKEARKYLSLWMKNFNPYGDYEQIEDEQNKN